MTVATWCQSEAISKFNSVYLKPVFHRFLLLMCWNWVICCLSAISGLEETDHRVSMNRPQFDLQVGVLLSEPHQGYVTRKRGPGTSRRVGARPLRQSPVGGRGRLGTSAPV